MNPNQPPTADQPNTEEVMEKAVACLKAESCTYCTDGLNSTPSGDIECSYCMEDYSAWLHFFDEHPFKVARALQAQQQRIEELEKERDQIKLRHDTYWSHTQDGTKCNCYELQAYKADAERMFPALKYAELVIENIAEIDVLPIKQALSQLTTPYDE